MLRNKEALISIPGFFLLWEIVGRLGWVDIELFPLPSAIFSLTAQLLATSEMWIHITRSLERLFWGYAVGWPLGVLLALATSLSVHTRNAVTPFVNFGYALPKVALFPLYLVLFGIDDLSKVLLIATGVFFLVYIAVFNGLILLLSNPLLNVARVYSVKGFRFWYKIIGKGLVLDIITGSKAAFGYGLVLVVVAESQMSRHGIGYYLWQSWEQFRVIDIYCAVLIIGFIGMLSGFLFDRMTQSLLSKYTPN